jgi:colanic acid biosynthesis glycosyl transferase WcaI
MRVCIVNEFFYPDDTGGTGTVLSDLARTLRQDYGEVEIDVVTSDKLYRDWDVRLPEFTDWDGIRIFRLNTPHPGGLSALPRIAVNTLFGLRALGKLHRLGHYDLLLVGTAPPTVAMAASLYKRLTGTPFLYVVYDLDPDRAVAMKVLSPRNPIVGVLRRLQRGWLRAADRVIVLGRCMQDYVGRAYGLPPKQIEAIPIGADDEAVRPLGKRTRFRAEHGLDGFVLCYTGNFGRYHDFDTLLDAARELRDRQAGVTFVLVGGGAQKDHIVRRIADEGLDNVRLFPFVAKDDYPDLLASADASFVTLEPGMEGLCVPSKFYSILASGRPAVATVSPVCEVARVIAEAGCGVRVDPGDARGLVEALLHLSGSPETAEAMGACARTVLEQHYSNRRVAAQYYRVMRSVVRKDARIVLREAPATREVPVLLVGDHDRREREPIAAWTAHSASGADDRFSPFPSDPDVLGGL